MLGALRAPGGLGGLRVSKSSTSCVFAIQLHELWGKFAA